MVDLKGMSIRGGGQGCRFCKEVDLASLQSAGNGVTPSSYQRILKYAVVT